MTCTLEQLSPSVSADESETAIYRRSEFAYTSTYLLVLAGIASLVDINIILIISSSSSLPFKLETRVDSLKSQLI